MYTNLLLKFHCTFLLIVGQVFIVFLKTRKDLVRQLLHEGEHLRILFNVLLLLVIIMPSRIAFQLLRILIEIRRDSFSFFKQYLFKRIQLRFKGPNGTFMCFSRVDDIEVLMESTAAGKENHDDILLSVDYPTIVDLVDDVIRDFSEEDKLDVD